MKLMDIVKKARHQGHSVTFRKRSDGGITVTSLDGVKYTDLISGNKALRAITGEELSPLQKQQRAAINRPLQIPEGAGATKIKHIKERAKARRHSQKQKAPLTEFEKKVKRVQRIWRENVDTEKHGRITMKKLRNIQKEHGEKAFEDALKKYEAYARGYAYEGNVMALMERYRGSILKELRSIPVNDGNEQILKKAISDAENLIGKMQAKIATFKEEWIPAINDIIYDAVKMRESAPDDDAELEILMQCTFDIDSIVR